jgi:hypothetical protein
MTATAAAETPDDNKKQIKVVEKSKKVDNNASAADNIEDDVEDIASLSVGGIFRGTFIIII